jgi:hypothetical protein
LPATEETDSATASISASESWPLNEGIPPWPFVTRSSTSDFAGFASSRFGPTLPVEPASASVWQPVQPAELKTCLPSGLPPPPPPEVVGAGGLAPVAATLAT